VINRQVSVELFVVQGRRLDAVGEPVDLEDEDAVP
jgi:hypothetical protein